MQSDLLLKIADFLTACLLLIILSFQLVKIGLVFWCLKINSLVDFRCCFKSNANFPIV